jgi:hypothetical protein
VSIINYQTLLTPYFPRFFSILSGMLNLEEARGEELKQEGARLKALRGKVGGALVTFICVLCTL